MIDYLNEEWLTGELKKEITDTFQPLYEHLLTETEIIDIANTLVNLAEISIKFNWRINNA